MCAQLAHISATVLDAYLQRYAGQDAKRGVARVFIALPPGEPRTVAGFYTLSAGSVATLALPEK
jgi:hypothetical protein